MLNWASGINGTGYGLAGAKISHELLKMGLLAHITVIGPPDPHAMDPELEDFIQKRCSLDMSLPAVKLWHQHDLASMPTTTIRVGWTIYEVALNDYEVANMNSCDLVVVCSQWAERLARSCGVSVPIEVVPLGVDTDMFFPPRERPDTSTYRFVNVGKLETRKGHYQLVQSFAEEFHGEKDVELWLSIQNPFLPADVLNDTFQRMKQLHPGIAIIPRSTSQSGVARTLRRAHCGVFPTRAEGFNLPLLESMACGLPVIAPNTTAHTQFVKESNTIILHKTKEEPAHDGVFFHGRGVWHVVDDNELKAAMRRAYEERICTNPGGIDTAQELTWENAAKQLVEVLLRRKVLP